LAFAPATLQSIGSRLAWLAIALPLLSGCSASTHTATVLTPPVSDSAKKSVYPDFSQPLTSAMPQLSDQDAAKIAARLSALGAQRQAGSISDAEYWRRVNALKSLAPPAQ
jgi:hypothetical protein